MELKDVLAENLKNSRLKHHYSQEKFANEVGLSASHLRDIEHGKGNPTLDTIERIAKGFHVPIESMLLQEPELPENIKIISHFLARNLNCILKLPPNQRTLFVRAFEQLVVLLSYNIDTEDLIE